MFWNWQKLLHQNLCNFWTKRQIVMKFWHFTFEGGTIQKSYIWKSGAIYVSDRKLIEWCVNS